MKCAYCGAEIGLDEKYCSKCGKEVQIVPSYNVLDDDLHTIVSDIGLDNDEKNKQSKSNNKNKKPLRKNSNFKVALSIIIGIAIIAIVLGLFAYFNTKKEAKSFDYQYNKAQNYAANNLDDKAIECYQLALDIDHDSTAANMELAELYKKNSKDNEAINLYLNVISYDPTSMNAYQELIQIYQAQNDTDSILKLMSKVSDDNVMTLFQGYQVTTPAFETEPGKYTGDLTLTISSGSNERIYYTIDGTDPSEKGKMYTGKITLTVGTTDVRAVAINDYNIISDEIEGSYEIMYLNPSKPSASIESGQYELPQNITIEIPTDCTVYYTWDGTVPTSNSEHYMGSFSMIEGNNILSIIAVDGKGMSSDVVRYNYIAVLATEGE